MRLIDGDRLLKLFIETMEIVKENPKMTREERHIICAIDTVGEMIKDAPTFDTLPPNDPLTLEQLREMYGEPVWVETPGVRKYGRWGIVDGLHIESKTLFLCGDYTCRDYGENWLAYRRKPEEGET